MYAEAMPMHEGRELPQFTLRQIDLPEVVPWDVNGQYYVIMKIEMVGKRNMKDLDASSNDRQKVEGDFRVMSIKALGDKPVDANSLAQADWENTVAKAKSGNM